MVNIGLRCIHPLPLECALESFFVVLVMRRVQFVRLSLVTSVRAIVAHGLHIAPGGIALRILTSPLDERDWSVLSSYRFTPGERCHGLGRRRGGPQEPVWTRWRGNEFLPVVEMEPRSSIP
jgi:hypothetical protein